METKQEILDQIKERLKTEFVPLFLEDGRPAGAGYSKKTKFIYKDLDSMMNDYYRPHATEEEQKAIREFERAERAERGCQSELSRFEKAKKIKFSEYKGEQFFSPHEDGNWDGFFADIEDFIEELFNTHGSNYADWPKYVWATKPRYIIRHKDVMDVFQNDMEEVEDGDYIKPSGVEELQEALDAFVEDNKELKQFTPDRSTALLIDDQIKEQMERYEDEEAV